MCTRKREQKLILLVGLDIFKNSIKYSKILKIFKSLQDDNLWANTTTQSMSSYINVLLWKAVRVFSHDVSKVSLANLILNYLLFHHGIWNMEKVQSSLALLSLCTKSKCTCLTASTLKGKSNNWLFKFKPIQNFTLLALRNVSGGLPYHIPKSKIYLQIKCA